MEFNMSPLGGDAPKNLLRALSEMKKQQEIRDQLDKSMKALNDKAVGEVETHLLPQFVQAVSQDINISNMEAMTAYAAFENSFAAVTQELNKISYWCSAHVCQALIYRLELEKQFQLAAGANVESVVPGATSRVGDIMIPPPESNPQEQPSE